MELVIYRFVALVTLLISGYKLNGIWLEMSDNEGLVVIVYPPNNYAHLHALFDPQLLLKYLMGYHLNESLCIGTVESRKKAVLGTLTHS